jgi:hypothetical protein
MFDDPRLIAAMLVSSVQPAFSVKASDSMAGNCPAERFLANASMKHG